MVMSRHSQNIPIQKEEIRNIQKKWYQKHLSPLDNYPEVNNSSSKGGRPNHYGLIILRKEHLEIIQH